MTGSISPGATAAATPEPNLLYSDVEDDLRSTVRELLKARCPAEAVAATYDGDRSLVAPLWRSLAVDLGLAGLLVAETAGGAGASAREAAVVLEELGRAVAPVPFLTSAVVAPLLLEEGELLAGLGSGERTAALTVPLPSTAWAVRPTVKADGAALWGEVRSVAGVLEADVLLVPVEADGGLEIRAVEKASADVETVVSLDMSRQVADVSFEGAASRTVVPGDAGARLLSDAWQTGAALLASEQVGVAQWCLDATVGYLQERRQFGRVVGGFQAVKHRLADMYVQVEQARAAARYAAATTADGDPDAVVAASVAQAYCSDVAVRLAEECVQLHGGIGMTWEHPAHLYLKRAKADQVAFGTAAQHRAYLATLVDLPHPGGAA